MEFKIIISAFHIKGTHIFCDAKGIYDGSLELVKVSYHFIL